MTGKHRGIKLKSYHDGDPGFQELLGMHLDEPEPVDDPESAGAIEVVPVMTPRQVVARRLRKELEAALQILDEALEAVVHDELSPKPQAEKQ